MTIDQLARSAQQEFMAIRSEMVTKGEFEDGLRQTENRILAAIREIHEDIERIYVWMREIDNRVSILEKER